jgi:hypothetical protein
MTATNAPNPYAPPKTRVVDHEPESHGLKHRSVLMAIVFTIVTFGFYFLIWWFRRRPGLNRLNSPKKISLWPLLLVIVLYVVQFVVAFMQEAAPDALSPAVGLAASIFQIFVGIAMIVQAFRAKDIIEDHAAPDPNSGPMFGTQVKLSGVMTFFFSIFYLQWAINRYVIAAQR